MVIVWKDSPMNPSKNFTKLLQFIGAYAATTIDKETQVQMLLKEKKQRIVFLKQ